MIEENGNLIGFCAIEVVSLDKHLAHPSAGTQAYQGSMNKKPAQKKIIIIPKKTANWADKALEEKGFGSNFSGYIADLIRRDWELEKAAELKAEQERQEELEIDLDAVFGQIIDEIQKMAKDARRKNKRF